MSDSVRPHRRQPTRLPRPWDSPGKNTGVGCHFLLQCMKLKSESEIAQSCPTPTTPWTAAYRALLSMGFSRQEYWSGVPLPSPHCMIYVYISLIHFILQQKLTQHCKATLCMHAKLLQPCLTLHDAMHSRLPGSSVHGALQARILQWVAVPSSRGSSQPRDQTCGSCVVGGFFTAEPAGMPKATIPAPPKKHELIAFLKPCL